MSRPSLDKGPKEGRNTWALGQGEVTEIEEQEGREGVRLAQACLCSDGSLGFTHRLMADQFLDYWLL